MSDNTGGPAFPVVGHFYGDKLGGQLQHGMTLRDYFAAKALAAMITHHGIYDDDQPLGAMTTATMHDYDSEAMAATAYAYADEMLKERAK